MPSSSERVLERQLEHAREPLTRLRLLLAQLDRSWDQSRARLDGLTDDEYFWEPAAGCWSVRRQPDGTFLSDWAWPAPDPAPFTTIAWRLSHLGLNLSLLANYRFGDRSLTIGAVVWPGSADAAIAWVDQAFDIYREGVAGLRDHELDSPPDGPPGYIGTRFPTAMNIQDMSFELIHHGAEIALLRDLYQARDGRP